MSNAYVKPIFTAKLAEKITVPKTAIAIAIGVSSGYLYTAIRDEKISLSYELAAELIYKRDIEKEQGKCAVIHAAPHVIKTVSDLVSALGGKFHIIP